MVAEMIGGILAAGFGLFFVIAFLIGAIELIGKIYGTFRCLIRKYLSTEQRVIYLLLIWFIPLGWLIYFLLGTERTQHLFADVDIF